MQVGQNDIWCFNPGTSDSEVQILNHWAILSTSQAPVAVIAQDSAAGQAM